MLTIYDTTGNSLLKHNETAPLTKDSVWFDLLNPTPEEDKFVEQALGISVPTRAEMREIEASSRFYQENGAAYMTAFIVYNIEEPTPSASAITFILAGNHLVTVRYAEPKAFPLFLTRVEKGDAACTGGAPILIGLLETIIQRMADLIEKLQDEVDRLGLSIFDMKAHRRDRNARLDVVLKGTGKLGDLVARAQESATSVGRVLFFFESVAQERGCDARISTRINAAQRDVTSLKEHMTFLTGRIGFLLDATLGMITTEQNQIIKLFSVMAVMLMPPTLVASIYGMNFEAIHEFKWEYGYWWALGLMLVAALIPFIYFKRKGWL
ncbi:MAG: magnesium transporter CorA family protein [Hyphomicrobium sp.]